MLKDLPEPDTPRIKPWGFKSRLRLQTADCVYAVVNAPGILYFLNAERHKNGGAFGCEGTGCPDSAQAIGQCGVQTILLLVAQDGELSKALVSDSLQSLGICVQLLQGVGHVDQGNVGKDHALVAGTQVIQELLVLRTELLQLVGDGGGKIVVCVLFLLPAGYIAFHAQDTGLHILHRFIGRDRQNVNGEHEVPGEVRQIGYHAVFDIAGVLPEEQDTAHLAAHLEVVSLKAHPVRGNGVFEMMAQAHSGGQVKLKFPFFTGAKKIIPGR